MDLPLLCGLFAGFALSLYVALDGFDLGVGALLLIQSDQRQRDGMVDSIMPTWDGNETWLVMAGVALLAGFPIAYGILMPAFYLPLITMLLALGLRGVSFEFRHQLKSGGRAWDVAFGLGSVVAALMQGVIVGGLVSGVSISGERFSGGVLDTFKPFPLLTGVALLVGYVVLGAGWLHLKSTAALRSFSERILRSAAPAFLALAAASCIGATFVQPAIRDIWRTEYPILILIVALFLFASVMLVRAVGGRADGRPFALGLALFGLAISGLGLAIFPDVVPFRLSLWAASSSPLSQIFLLVGAVVVTPVVLSYSAFAYWVFRGKTPAEGWEE